MVVCEDNIFIDYNHKWIVDEGGCRFKYSKINLPARMCAKSKSFDEPDGFSMRNHNPEVPEEAIESHL